MARIEGKIAALVTKTTVIINRGSSHGVKNDMLFSIRLPMLEITDPDDPANALSGVSFEKGKLRIQGTFEKMSQATLEPTLKNIIRDIAELLGEATTKTSYPPIEGKPMLEDDAWKVKVGDIVWEIQSPENKKESKSTETSIKFEYLPDPPTLHGWILAEQQETPEFKRYDDNFVNYALQIEPKPNPLSRYYIEKPVEEKFRYARFVSFVIHRENVPTCYAKVKLRRDGSDKEYWLRIEPGKEGDRPMLDKKWPDEICTPVVLQAVQGPWVSLEANIDDALRFATGPYNVQGYELLAVRIRGAGIIHRIQFLS